MCLPFSSFLFLFWNDSPLLLVWSGSLLNSDLNVVARTVRGDLSPLNRVCLLLVELDMSVSTVFPILCPCSRSFNALCMFASNCLLEMKNHGLLIELATHSSSCSVIRSHSSQIIMEDIFFLRTILQEWKGYPQGVEAVELDLSKIDG